MSEAGKRIVAVGGSDAGNGDALRACEPDPDSAVTVVVADALRPRLRARRLAQAEAVAAGQDREPPRRPQGVLPRRHPDLQTGEHR
ncbi:hypothetical protein [Streptomyces sp. CC219B]|uniref:hypothetical protein n=1 Tax=Streptomyces sp. CC219B TaxID=3044574 RepID=UPI0024A9B456|nr:hypothetical protein [Streptomyces sp. CC219B]